MPRANCAFRQTEIRRAIKGVEMAGYKVAAVEIKPDGTIVVQTASGKLGEEKKMSLSERHLKALDDKEPLSRADFVQTFKSPKNGRVYSYYRRWGKRIRIRAEPGSQEFFAEIKMIEKAGEAKTKASPGTLSFVMEAYKKSQKWLDLKVVTRQSYDRAFNLLQPFGDDHMSEFTRPAVIQLRDEVLFPKHGRWQANYCVSMLSILAKFAHDKGWTKENHLKEKIDHIPKSRHAREANRPWTAAEREVVLAEAPWQIRMPIALAMCSGLRKTDVFDLKVSDIEDGQIVIKTSKRGTRISIPIHPVLAETLAQRPKTEQFQVCLTAYGQPMTMTGFDSIWQKFKARLESEEKIGKDLTFHGLRHTLGTLLTEAGMHQDHVRRVLGHRSAAMTVHYTAEAMLPTDARDILANLGIQKGAEQNKYLISSGVDGID